MYVAAYTLHFEHCVCYTIITCALVDIIDHTLSPCSRPFNLQSELLCSTIHYRPVMVQDKGRGPFIKLENQRLSKKNLPENTANINTHSLCPWSEGLFLDYSNIETAPTYSIGPLLDTYQVLIPDAPVLQILSSPLTKRGSY